MEHLKKHRQGDLNVRSKHKVDNLQIRFTKTQTKNLSQYDFKNSNMEQSVSRSCSHNQTNQIYIFLGGIYDFEFNSF